MESKEWSEAERHWRLALEKKPGSLGASLGLGNTFLKQRQLAEFERMRAEAPNTPVVQREFVLLQARHHLENKQYPAARAVVAQILQNHSDFLAARVVLSHILLQEGDWRAAEDALNDILARDPANAKKTRRNLQGLMHQRDELRETQESDSALPQPCVTKYSHLRQVAVPLLRSRWR